MQEQYHIGSVVFDKWSIKRMIGEGSFGRVFEIQREDFGEVYKAALKVITVPQSQAEVHSALEEGMTFQQAEQYFYGVVEDIVREFAIMAKLKGTANVVGYEDHAVIRHEDGIGWDILIRMELLNPLLPYAYAHPFARRDIIRLGIDICRALELCQKYNVIHRDIKPENIFVSDNGDFKLGDFGIARTIDRTMSGLSKKGTYHYMAPEVYRGAEYGFSVDIYSLGIVLYRLLNKNRVPFLPPPPEPITFRSRELALARRMGGEALPAPAYAQGRLAEIIQKACAFDPKQRYAAPSQMRQELEAILYDEADTALIYPDGDELALMENQYASRTRQTETAPEDRSGGDGTEPVFDASAGDRDALDASCTENVFGGLLREETSRTENVFAADSPREEGTSRTESIFGTPPEKIKTAAAPPAEQEKTQAPPAEQKKEAASPAKKKKTAAEPPVDRETAAAPAGQRKVNKKVKIAALALLSALAVCLLLWAVGLFGQRTNGDDPQGTEPSEVDEPLNRPAFTAGEGEVLTLRQKITATNRSPMETVRVAVLACEGWLSGVPSLGSTISGVQSDTYLVDDWLKAEGVITTSYTNEVYYSTDDKQVSGALRVILSRLRTALKQYDLVICCSPWVEQLWWRDDEASTLVDIANANPGKELLLSGGQNMVGHSFAGGRRLPENLTLALTDNNDDRSTVQLPAYLLGAAAAAQSQSKKVGIAVTESWDSFDAQFFAIGMQSVDPKAELLLYGDVLTNKGEAEAVRQLCQAGADVIWCSGGNEAALAAADEWGASTCGLFNETETPAVDLAVTRLGTFLSDAFAAVACMQNGWALKPYLTVPECVYVPDGVTDELANAMTTAVGAFDTVISEEANVYGHSLVDYVPVSVLHMPDIQGVMSFLPQPFDGLWMMRHSYDYQSGGNETEYYQSADYFRMSSAQAQKLADAIAAQADHTEAADGGWLYEIEYNGRNYHVELLYYETELAAHLGWYTGS